MAWLRGVHEPNLDIATLSNVAVQVRVTDLPIYALLFSGSFSITPRGLQLRQFLFHGAQALEQVW